MKQIKKPLSNQSGQMVILVMLVLVVALTIGLSLLTRTTENTRQSTNTELSNRAYSAAEAGIEEALRTGLNQVNPVSIGSDGPTQTNFKTTVNFQGNDTNPFIFPNPLSKDETVQLWLFNYNNFRTSSTFPAAQPTSGCNASAGNYFAECSANQNKVTISWGSSDGIPAVTPALEVSLVYLDTLGNFQIEKCAYDPNSLRLNNFLLAGEFDGTICAQSATQSMQTETHTVNSKQFYYRKDLILNPTGKRYLLMRLKLLYNDNNKHEIAVNPNGQTLPAQGQVIESTGNAGDVVRKIRVYQSFPTLPGLFDFVLFNGSTDPLTKN